MWDGIVGWYPHKGPTKIIVAGPQIRMYVSRRVFFYRLSSVIQGCGVRRTWGLTVNYRTTGCTLDLCMIQTKESRIWFCSNNILINIFYSMQLWGQSSRRGTKCDCKTDWLWVRSPFEEVKYLFKFIFPFLRSGLKEKTRRWALTFNTQCLQNSAESGERSVLTLASLPAVCGIQREADLFILFYSSIRADVLNF